VIFQQFRKFLKKISRVNTCNTCNNIIMYNISKFQRAQFHRSRDRNSQSCEF